MPFIRAIQALIIAAAVAFAPAASGMAVPSHEVLPRSHDHGKASHHRDQAALHHQGSAAKHQHDMATGCCPSEQTAPAPKSKDHCGGLTGCALCYLNVLPMFGTLSHPLEQAATLSWGVAEAVPLAEASPPFRPPRS
jgi:hypothetical protein